MQTLDEHFRVKKGSPRPLGPSVQKSGVNFALFSAHATAVEVCLFSSDDSKEVARIALPQCRANIWHGFIEGLSEGQLYGYRVHGPYAPHDGHRFNPHKLLIDPYAKYLQGNFIQHDALYGYDPISPEKDLSFNTRDSAPYMPKSVVGEPSAELRPKHRPDVAPENTIIYEVHVKGATKLKPDISNRLRGTFEGLSDPSMIAHFQALGVTSIELLPVQAFFSEPRLTDMGLSNYWGYNPISYFAPEQAYMGPSGKQSFQTMVTALHTAGIEVILDVVYNHTAESWELGPTLSFRGIDNKSYYSLQSENPRHYVNDTGCGNQLNMDHPAVLQLTLDSLRYWVSEMGVDGFRFDLATTLARCEGDFNPRSGFLSAIGQDPTLSNVKLIAEPWDIGFWGYRLGEFPSNFMEWNDQFRDTVRSFWRSDKGVLPDFAAQLLGSADCFDHKGRSAHSSVNFITSHDGFTLQDTVSYNRKHNRANGEENRDGHSHNLSDNCGVEGQTSSTEITKKRLRRKKNMLATLMLSQGTPMLLGGDEFSHSQNGNNNAYCQDNEITWFNWTKADRALIKFVGQLTALRRRYGVLRRSQFTHGNHQTPLGVKDVTWLTNSGNEMQSHTWENSNTSSFGLLLAAGIVGRDDITESVLIVMNNGDHFVDFTLPPLLNYSVWDLALTTAETSPEVLNQNQVKMAPESVLILSTPNPVLKFVSETGMVNQMAEDLGIVHSYHDLAGHENITSMESKRALLSGLGFDTQTPSAVQLSYARHTTGKTRLLPPSLVLKESEPYRVVLNLPSHTAAASVSWQVTLENDQTVKGQDHVGHDGGFILKHSVPAGYHQLVVTLSNGLTEQAHLIIVPHTIYGVDYLDNLGGALGVTAALYGLKSSRNFGIGDFEDLAKLAETLAPKGVDFIGINPVHALPAGKDFYAPYSPSSRVFLNIMHIAPDLIPDLSGQAFVNALQGYEKTLQQCQGSELVDYENIYGLKIHLFEKAFDQFCSLKHNHERVKAFEAFCDHKGQALLDHALFDVLFEQLPDDQKNYDGFLAFETGLKNRDTHAIKNALIKHRQRVKFYSYLQWVADQQLSHAQERALKAGMRIGLYLDMAVGIVPGGGDVWMADDHATAKGISLGAPGDAANPTGQMWNLAPLNPRVQEQTGFDFFAAIIRGVMAHAGAVRIDHVLGLNRSFWCAAGGDKTGAYVTYPLQDLLGIIAVESHRAKCMVIGEDLGTVPEGFRDSLAAWQMMGCSIFFIDRTQDGGFLPSSDVRRTSLASLSNHDFPTIAGFWEEADLKWRMDLEIGSEPARINNERKNRAQDRRAILHLLQTEGLLHDGLNADHPPKTYTPEINSAMHAYLARTDALAVAIQLEDLTGARGQPNVPGTVNEQPNWRRKYNLYIDEIAQDTHTNEIFLQMQEHWAASNQVKDPKLDKETQQ